MQNIMAQPTKTIYEELHWNPLELATARKAWRKTDTSLPWRCVKTCGAALLDLFVVSPFNMSLGNASLLAHNGHRYSTDQKTAAVALTLLGTLYAVALYGTLGFFTGKALLPLAVASSTLALMALRLTTVYASISLLANVIMNTPINRD